MFLNHIPGDLEATMLKTFCQGANLRAMVQDSGAHSTLHLFKDAFDKAFHNGGGGHHLHLPNLSLG